MNPGVLRDDPEYFEMSCMAALARVLDVANAKVVMDKDDRATAEDEFDEFNDMLRHDHEFESIPVPTCTSSLPIYFDWYTVRQAVRQHEIGEWMDAHAAELNVREYHIPSPDPSPDPVLNAVSTLASARILQ